MNSVIKNLLDKLGIQSKDDVKKLVSQFLKFGLVGLSNTLVSMAVYYLFLWVDPELYMIGSVLGTILSIANAFFWNDHFVFKSKERGFKSTLTRLGKTYVSYGGTSVLSIVLLWIEVNLFGIGKTVAPVVNLIITIPLNFLLNKLWTFNS